MQLYRIKRGLIMMTVCLLVPWLSWGSQIKTLSTDNTISIAVSSQHLNHLMIPHEKILQVIGHEGEYQFKTNHEGSLFIQPQITTPITLFLTTEEHHTYGLTLLPKMGLGSQTIILQSPVASTANHLNDALALLKTLREQPHALKKALGYEPSPIPAIGWKRLDKLENKNAQLVGTVYALKNQQAQSIQLVGQEMRLATPHTLVMQFQMNTLKPYQTTLLYQVNHVT